MRKKIYIETTIPSLYHEIREEPEIVAKRNWTRFWWNNERDNYDLFTSIAVITELEGGEYPIKDNCLSLIE